MALSDTQEVKLAISAETLGTSDVSRLADEVEALARAGSEAGPEFERLAAELRRLDQQQVRIDGLQEAIGGAKAAWSAFSDARQQVQVLDKALADARGAGASKEAIRLLETELRRASATMSGAEKAWQRQNAALKASRSEAAAAGVDTRNLGEAQEQLATALEKTRGAIASQVDSVNRARTAEAERAREARAAADEETRLAAIVAASKKKLQQAAQEQLAAEKRAYAEAEDAARRYAAQTRTIADSLNKAFSTIGIRSTDTIRAEILQINQALMRMSADVKVTGADFDRAWAAGQARIQALEAELNDLGGAARGAMDPLTESVGRATGSVGALVTRLGPVAGAIAAAFSVNEVARAVVEFDSLNNTLEAITGSADKAAKELGYIVATSDRLGLELGSASKAWAQFAAVTRGTTMEGQGARDVFEAVAGAMSRLGKSAADTDGALLALGQMVSKGVVSMEELRQQLAERLPGAMKAAAEGLGVTEAELIKLVESGQVLAEDLLPAMAARLRELYKTGAEVDGYTASWNRLTSAVKLAFGAFGQSGAVSSTVTGTLGVLTKTVQGLGFAMAAAAEGVTVLGGSIGALAAAFRTGNFAELKTAIADLSDQSGERLRLLADRFNGVGDASESAAARTVEAAQQVMQGNQGWLSVTTAYSQATQAATEFADRAQKALQARQAEATAIVQHAQAVGSEVALREAEATAAMKVAVATDQLAAAKQVEVLNLQSQLQAMQAVVAASGQESDAKRKIIQATQERLDKLQAERDALRANADAALIEAAARAAQVETIKNNANQLDRLRTSYISATAEVRRLQALEAAGVPVSKALSAARVTQTRAAVLYNDAVSDTVLNMRREQEVATASANVDLQRIQLKREQARSSELVAKGLGNERAATWANVEAKRAEGQAIAARARLAVQQAESSVKIAQKQLDEAKAVGANAEAHEHALKVAQEALTVKLLEQKGSAELVKQLDAEAAALIRTMNARKSAGGDLQEVASAGAQAADGMQQAAVSADLVGESMSSTGSIAAVMAGIIKQLEERIGAYSQSALAMVKAAQSQAISFTDVANRVRQVGVAAGQLVAEDQVGQLQAQFDELSAAAREAAEQAREIERFKGFRGEGWAGFDKYVASLVAVEGALANAKARLVDLDIQVARFNERVDEGSIPLELQERQLRGLVTQAERLGSQQLNGLRSALADVRRQMQSVADAARDTLGSVQDEIDQLNGNLVAVERRRFQQRREDIQSQLEEATATGNQQAITDLRKALDKLSQLEAAKVKQVQAEQKAQTESTRKSNSNTSSSGGSSGEATKTVNVRISLPDGSTRTVATKSDADAQELLRILEELERRSQ